jgi:hypothetical protein
MTAADGNQRLKPLVLARTEVPTFFAPVAPVFPAATNRNPDTGRPPR